MRMFTVEVDRTMATDFLDGNAFVELGRRLSRYDLVLVLIPAAFCFAAVASRLASVPTHVTLAGAATVGALALFDGLFVNPPRSGSGTA